MLACVLWLSVLLCTAYVSADTPANCTYEDAQGKWLFKICENDISCDMLEYSVMYLRYPNIAIDKYGNEGTWTLIYNQGFEVTIAHRKWLVMFAYGPSGESYCHQGISGWSHDTLIRQWKWVTAKKLGESSIRAAPVQLTAEDLDRPYIPNSEFVKNINTVQNTWEATDYPELSKFTLRDILRRAGGLKSMFPRPKLLKAPVEASAETLKAVRALPKEFDWRNSRQGNVVSPVRNQGHCGSCYAFASAAALEARIRIASNFSHQPILSPQDVVDCSPYSQGCEGGFPYLVAGKYAEDYGIPIESCYPYKGVDGKCSTPTNCTRYYTTNYAYVGGYYGASNEYLMQLELVHKGPFPVGFEVYNDFVHYKRGVYQHTKIADSLNRFNPFVLTNHAVVIVGYGTDETTGLPYWTVKNSWGEDWGENGFFRILRGANECGIESLSVTFDPVL